VESLNDHGLLVPVFRIGIPDQLVDHASPAQSKEALGLTPAQMAGRISDHFGQVLRTPAAAQPVSV
jgi:1-deoxy-D-xylulose-5-phosphate synthase